MWGKCFERLKLLTLTALIDKKCPLCKINLCIKEFCNVCYNFLLNNKLPDNANFSIYSIKANSCYVYNDKILTIILDIKNNDNSFFIDFVSNAIVDEINNKIKIVSLDIISCVPMYWLKFIYKGYNHSQNIAYSVFLKLKQSQFPSLTFIPFLLKKNKITNKQSSLNYQNRIIKKHHIYLNKKYLRLGSKKIIVIDDVMTTGSTFNACNEALNFLNSNITYISFARTLQENN